MIDCENEVFATVATALRNTFKPPLAEKPIFVSGEAVAAPATFPTVTLVEDDNSTYQRSLDSSGQENHAQVMYTANVYSNKMPGKKAECKSIMAAIDAQMLGMGFLRVGNGPQEMPNANASIYRMVARYRAVISKDKTIYRK
jgi:hypothetical protein